MNELLKGFRSFFPAHRNPTSLNLNGAVRETVKCKFVLNGTAGLFSGAWPFCSLLRALRELITLPSTPSPFKRRSNQRREADKLPPPTRLLSVACHHRYFLFHDSHSVLFYFIF